VDVHALAENISGIFINLASEYSAILSGLFIIFAFIGFCISGSSVFALLKAGDAHRQQPVWGVIAAKMVGGVGMIDLSFWAKTWSATLWSLDDPLGIEEYSSYAAGTDYAQAAMYAALGFMVICGYVTIGSAYLKITQLGYLSPESRGNQLGSIFSRILAGSALISCMHIAKALGNSTGLST
tara:strand:+ start:1795 stop:2340 length:546 start_codon:yes stop_codon:yes gene_type:complete